MLSNIQSTYQKTNTPPPPPATPGNTSGTAIAATTAQLANYNLALSLLGTDPNNARAPISSRSSRAAAQRQRQHQPAQRVAAALGG